MSGRLDPALEALAAHWLARRTTGLLVVRDGRTLLERHGPLADGQAVFRSRFVHGTAADGALLEDVASQQKSVVALLVAIAVEQGWLDLEQPVSQFLGLGWSRADPGPERAIRVRHLLEMTSGLDQTLAPVAEPGERFHYNTPAYAVLLPLLEAATGQPLDGLTRGTLTGPLGMTDTAWCRRGDDVSGLFGNPRGLVTTPRDLARLGQAVLDGGRAADGRRVMRAASLAALLRPTVSNAAYGRLWWLNTPGPWQLPRGESGPGPFVPTAAPDACFALGSEGRVLMLVPSQQLIVVRLGAQPPELTLRPLLIELAGTVQRALTA